MIAACSIGGASACGRLVRGAINSVVIMGATNNRVSILGIGVDHQQVINGLTPLGTVCVDIHNQER